MNWVPLINANPSFAPRGKGAKSWRVCIFAADMISPFILTFPNPMMGRNRCAKGARSPEAPTDPWEGTSGMIS